MTPLNRPLAPSVRLAHRVLGGLSEAGARKTGESLERAREGLRRRYPEEEEEKS